MDAQTVEAQALTRQASPSRKAVARVSLVGFILSVLVHGGAIFLLFKFPPSAPTDGMEQEIPIEIVVDASRSQPLAAPASPASVDVPPSDRAEPLPIPDTTAAKQPNSASTESLEALPPRPDIVPEQAPSAVPREEASAPIEPSRQEAAPAVASGEEPAEPASASSLPVPPPTETPSPKPIISDNAPSSSAEQAASPPVESIVGAGESAEPMAPVSAHPATPSPAIGPPPPAKMPAAAAPPPPTETVLHRRAEESQKRSHSEAEARRRAEVQAKRDTETRHQAEARALAARKDASAVSSASASSPPSATADRGANSTDYRNAVMRHLAAFKRYPDGAREHGIEGRAIVGFTLDAAGRVIGARIVRSSGQTAIDAETLGMVQRASPFPTPPQRAQRSFSAAIDFHLN